MKYIFWTMNQCVILYFSMKPNFWKTTWHSLALLPSLPSLFQVKRNISIQMMSWQTAFLEHGLLQYRVCLPMTPTCPWFLQPAQSKSLGGDMSRMGGLINWYLFLYLSTYLSRKNLIMGVHMKSNSWQYNPKWIMK